MVKKYIALICLLGLIGCQSPIPSNTINKVVDPWEPLPELTQSHYDIATRVVIVDSSNLDDFYSQINSLGYYYPKFTFVVTQTEVKPCYDMVDCFKDSLDYPNVISIYKMGPSLTMAGWSDFPWNGPGRVFIFGNQTLDALGHEIGHALGLYHTFNDGGDFVDDTLDTLVHNDTNLMSYSSIEWYLKSLTPGQLQRAEFMLNSLKKNWILN